MQNLSTSGPAVDPRDPRSLGIRRKGPDRKLTLDRETELVRDYCAGVKLEEMRAKYGLSKRGMYDVLERHGIARGRNRKA